MPTTRSAEVQLAQTLDPGVRCNWKCKRRVTVHCKQSAEGHSSIRQSPDRPVKKTKSLKMKHRRNTHCYRAMCFWCHVFLCIMSTVPPMEASEAPHSHDVQREHEYFLRKLFEKYGHNGVMTFEGFEHLLENLGLAQITFRDHDLSLHHPEGSTGFVDRHEHHEHTVEGYVHDDDEHHENEMHSRAVRQVTSHQELSSTPSENTTSSASSGHSSHLKTAEITFEKCLTATEILHTFDLQPETSTINPEKFLYLCPAIIYQLDQKHCKMPVTDRHMHHSGEGETDVNFKVWMFALLGVVVISLCGLLSVAVVPLMQKVFYHTLIQFLVGLAVGSLTGDALLHLLPHALSGHDHSEDGDGEEYVWHGLASIAGIYIFLIVERFLSIHSNHKHRKRSPKASNSVQSSHTPKKLCHPEEEQTKIGEKLSHHKQGSYGFAMDASQMDALEKLTSVPADQLELTPLNDGCHCMEIVDLKETDICGGDETDLAKDKAQDLVVIVKNGSSGTTGHCAPAGDSGSHHPICHSTSRDPTDECHTETLVYRETFDDRGFTVTVSDHHHHHHHGHSHKVPSSIAAVAWMVIIGDGLHNFSDGLAIGAAFASSLSGGLSTTIAVFCHELPHELGDFAVLLKAGMSVKQALLYNILSSVLCLIGMVIGILLGNTESATNWIFAGIAGMFLYIALVDMLPELSVNANHSRLSAIHQLGTQLLGVSLGVTTMFIIALYERDLQSILTT
ncbi:zinc transporter ZIP6-like isoform X2 [Ornithodoros turicata]|uniref:zinc transporter ZIP6-like isoform X2 n=1 Tax=Ornithodoros turicata TaxID=34597 RepID=UPI0031398BB0